MKYILFTIAFLLASNCLKAQGQFEKVNWVDRGQQGFPQAGCQLMPTLKVKYHVGAIYRNSEYLYPIVRI